MKWTIDKTMQEFLNRISPVKSHASHDEVRFRNRVTMDGNLLCQCHSFYIAIFA